MCPFTMRPKVARLFRVGYKKKEPNLDDSALSLCCLGRIQIYEWLRMKLNLICSVYQCIRTILNVNKFIVIYLNALLVVQKRYTCTTVF